MCLSDFCYTSEAALLTWLEARIVLNAFCLSLAAAQTGKLHFGVVLGWSVVGSMVLWFVANNVGGGSADAPDGGAPGLYDCCCLLGYCLLPLIAHALASLLIPKCGPSFHCTVVFLAL